MSEQDVIALVRSIAQQAAELAAEKAIEKWELLKKQQKEGRYSKRLQATKLLLKNYRILEKHCKEAAASECKKANYEAVDMLEELLTSDLDEHIFAESMKRSSQKTFILVEHISKIVELYKQICIHSSRKEDQYKYYVIHELFIKNMKDSKRLQTIEEMAAQIPCHRTMIYKYRDAAMKALSGLLFGLDGSESIV